MNAVKILEQEISVSFATEGDFWIVETLERLEFPEDLEYGKTIQEVFSSLQEALQTHYKLREDVLYFPDPDAETNFFMCAISKEKAPEEVQKNPGNFWFSFVDNEWLKIY